MLRLYRELIGVFAKGTESQKGKPSAITRNRRRTRMGTEDGEEARTEGKESLFMLKKSN